MRVIAAIVVLIWSAIAAQAAPSPHVVKFKEFQEAFAKGDIPAADAAGAEALLLAESNGAAPATVQILAANLAALRLSYGRDGAAAPLAQVVALHDAGQAAISAQSVELLRAWAALDAAAGPTRKRLQAAIAAGVDVEPSWRWSAIQALARAAGQAEDWSSMIAIGDLALGATDGADYPEDAAKARALTLRGAGKTMTARGFSSDLLSALEDFGQARRLLRTYSEAGHDGQITLGVRLYGEATAWQGATAALLNVAGAKALRKTYELDELESKQRLDRLNLCEFEPLKAKVDFPREAENKGLVGGVNGLAFIGPDSKITEFKLLSEVPRAQFAEAARAGIVGAQMTPKPSNRAECRRSYWYYVTVRFAFR